MLPLPLKALWAMPTPHLLCWHQPSSTHHPSRGLLQEPSMCSSCFPPTFTSIPISPSFLHGSYHHKPDSFILFMEHRSAYATPLLKHIQESLWLWVMTGSPLQVFSSPCIPASCLRIYPVPALRLLLQIHVVTLPPTLLFCILSMLLVPSATPHTHLPIAPATFLQLIARCLLRVLCVLSKT